MPDYRIRRDTPGIVPGMQKAVGMKQAPQGAATPTGASKTVQHDYNTGKE